MLKYFIVSLLIFSNLIYSETHTVYKQPQGEYAKIDVKDSFEASQILLGDKSSLKEKKKWASKIEKTPGSYNPGALFALGLFYMAENDFKKAALYSRVAVFRAVIDVKFSQDASLEDVPTILFSRVHAALNQYVNTPEKKEAWKEALLEATKQTVNWDKSTPRNYDDRWVCLHSIGAFTEKSLKKMDPQEKQKIIEEERYLFLKENEKYFK